MTSSACRHVRLGELDMGSMKVSPAVTLVAALSLVSCAVLLVLSLVVRDGLVRPGASHGVRPAAGFMDQLELFLGIFARSQPATMASKSITPDDSGQERHFPFPMAHPQSPENAFTSSSSGTAREHGRANQGPSSLRTPHLDYISALQRLHPSTGFSAKTFGVPQVQANLQARKLPAWSPAEGKYLLGYCHMNRWSNRLFCMQRALVLAALLNRTLIIPSLDVCRESGDRTGREGELMIDVPHLRRCLHAGTVLQNRCSHSATNSRVADSGASNSSAGGSCTSSVQPGTPVGHPAGTTGQEKGYGVVSLQELQEEQERRGVRGSGGVGMRGGARVRVSMIMCAMEKGMPGVL